MLPSRAMTWSLATASSFPTMSATLVGLYFSTHGISGPELEVKEEEEDAIFLFLESEQRFASQSFSPVIFLI